MQKSGRALVPTRGWSCSVTHLRSVNADVRLLQAINYQHFFIEEKRVTQTKSFIYDFLNIYVKYVSRLHTATESLSYHHHQGNGYYHKCWRRFSSLSLIGATPPSKIYIRLASKRFPKLLKSHRNIAADVFLTVNTIQVAEKSGQSRAERGVKRRKEESERLGHERKGKDSGERKGQD